MFSYRVMFSSRSSVQIYKVSGTILGTEVSWLCADEVQRVLPTWHQALRTAVWKGMEGRNSSYII